MNTGNIAKQTITLPTATFVQTYKYDPLDRLKEAKETVSNGATNWQQNFDSDRFGNRQFDNANGNTTTIPAGCTAAVCNPQIDPEKNRLIGYEFDASGNTTRHAENRKFTYDAENKQVKVETVDASGNVIAIVGQYSYDGDGKRIKKIVPATGETTIFVYDASGKSVAEYSTLVAGTNTTPPAQVSYLTNDHLGSPRAITNQFGQVTSRRDFMPFGEEISSPQRISTTGYAPDNTRQKFTGYQRDAESNLDFAQARMLDIGRGRFTSPDRYSKAVVVTGGFSLRLFEVQPQNWNEYAYCRNNPLGYVDRDGQHPIVAAAAVVAAGAAVGAVIGGGFELGKQKIWDGKETVDWNKVGGAATQGAIFGGVAPATGGTSIGFQVAALAAANVVGGAANRTISGDPTRPALDPVSIGIDGIAGGAGAYLAPLGTSMYMSATNASRNAAASQVDMMMASSPVPAMLPTLTRPVVTETIRNEVFHGQAQNLSNGVVRGATRTGTAGTLNFLMGFNLASPVLAPSQTGSSLNGTAGRDSKGRILSGLGCQTTKDNKGRLWQMCISISE